MSLHELIKKVKEDLDKRKKEYSYDWLGRSLAFNNYPPRDICSALKSDEKGGYSQICQIKKAQNGKKLDKNFDPLVLAQSYEKQNISAINIFTQPHFFDGDVELLTAVRRYASTPLIRDDILFDDYQLLESVVYGADSLILRAKILSKKQLSSLVGFSLRLGMEPVVEICDKGDLVKAIFAKSRIICINCKDFDSGRVDEKIWEELLPMIPNGKIILLNGLDVSSEVMGELNRLGIDGFFVDNLIKKDKN